MDSDWTRRASVVGGEASLHESRSDCCVLLSHISGGHWRFEPARGNCHFISAGNGARKRSPVLSCKLYMCLCVRTCECRELTGGKFKSQGCFLVLNIPPHNFPVRHRSNTDADSQICEWQAVGVAVAAVWRYPRALERSDLQCEVERGRSNVRGGRRGMGVRRKEIASGGPRGVHATV